MSEKELKILLKSYDKLKVEKELLSQMKNLDEKYNQLCRFMYILESCMEVLNTQEREIVQLHLIQSLTWNETIQRFEEKYGYENGYCNRTYQRMQKKAIEQMLNVIENVGVDEFSSFVSTMSEFSH